MSILKYKYKAHKFINYAFYIVVFIFGFLLGFSTEKIDFNKLISQVLMIDNVKAYTIVKSDTTTLDEDFIYNSFKSKFNFTKDPNDYAYFCTEFGSLILCYSMEKTIYNYTESRIDPNSSYNFDFYPGDDKTIIYRIYEIKIDISVEDYYVKDTWTSSGIGWMITLPYGASNRKTYTNVNVDALSDEDNKKNNVLDFKGTNLEFNENLFKDNPDFKEVCVNNYDTFSITSNQVQDYDDNNSPMYHSFDFMWFPNGMKGISTWIYDSEEHDHVFIPEKDENSFSGWWYWLDTKDEIDLYFDRDNPGLYLKTKGYKNKYSYYNYTLYPFEMTFTESYHRYQVFWFKDPYIEYLDGSKKEDSEQYCFYIKNEYDVNILKKNQNGDFESSITILGGINKDDITYENELNNNYKGFFSTINSFISQIRPTVIFINTHILELYTSMPLIVRTFIISFLVLILIRILIGMVVK